jgi:hypothetical protein
MTEALAGILVRLPIVPQLPHGSAGRGADALPLPGGARAVSPVVVVAPVRLVSEANVREHWAPKARRAREQRAVMLLLCRKRFREEGLVDRHGSLLGQRRLVVRIERLGKRRLDGDNLARACKAVRDGIADALRLDDGDGRIEWVYEQAIAKGYEVRIEVRETLS